MDYFLIRHPRRSFWPFAKFQRRYRSILSFSRPENLVICHGMGLLVLLKFGDDLQLFVLVIYAGYDEGGDFLVPASNKYCIFSMMGILPCRRNIS